MDEHLYWKGSPIIYSRDKGHGLILGGHHYQFDSDGGLSGMYRITRPVLEMVLKRVYPNPGMAMAANAHSLSKQTEQEKQG